MIKKFESLADLVQVGAINTKLFALREQPAALGAALKLKRRGAR